MKVFLQINSDQTAYASYPDSEQPDVQVDTGVCPVLSIMSLLGWLFDRTYFYDGKTHHIY